MNKNMQHIRKDVETPAKTLIQGENMIGMSGRIHSNISANPDSDDITGAIDKIGSKEN